MNSPPAVSARICSSIVAPLVLLAILFGGGSPTRATASKHLAVATHASKHAPVRVLPVERPDAPKAKPKPKPKPHRRATHVPAAIPIKHSVFSGLGAWIDLYDTLSIDQVIKLLREGGVQTLYLQTGRSDTRAGVAGQTGSWLVAAHRAGIKVVGWYLPYFSNVPFDVSRIVATARYRYAGQALDGVGVDIEYKGAVRSNAVWNHNVVREMALARGALGSAYPLASIPPPPLQMKLAPTYWRGFEWAKIARYSSSIMLMSYWSYDFGCPRKRLYCAYEYTKNNVLMTRQRTGGRVPIHIIGGVGDRITATQLRMFMRGARDAGADGASIYDVATTRPDWWKALRQLRALGS